MSRVLWVRPGVEMGPARRAGGSDRVALGCGVPLLSVQPTERGCVSGPGLAVTSDLLPELSRDQQAPSLTLTSSPASSGTPAGSTASSLVGSLVHNPEPQGCPLG